MKQNIIRGKRILLVDDEPSVRGTFRMVLELDGHTVTEANNGAEALGLFTKERFDLVVTDYEMPLMRGNELAVRIKQLAPKQPILMMTAYDKGLGDPENPVDSILSKPFGLGDLRGAIAKLLSNRQIAPIPTMPPTLQLSNYRSLQRSNPTASSAVPAH